MENNNLNPDDLNETLQRLHAELARTSSIDASRRELLTDILRDIQTLLGQDQVGQRDDASQSVVQRVKHAVDDFEESHPTLSSMLGQIADALSSIGI